MTNEQRAHDLTIVVLNRLDLSENAIDATPFDFYHKYIEVYKTALQAFNRDYPDGL